MARLTPVASPSSSARTTRAPRSPSASARSPSPCRQGGAELIVVDNSEDGTDAIDPRTLPLGPAPPCARHAVHPRALGHGMAARHRVEVVALTTAHCIPAPDWVDRVLDAHARPTRRRASAAPSRTTLRARRRTGPSTSADITRSCPRSKPAPCGHRRGQCLLQTLGARPLPRRLARRVLGARRPRRNPPRGRRAPPRAPHRRAPQPLVRRRGFLRNRFRHGQQYGRSQGAGREGRPRRHARSARPSCPAVLTGRVARAVTPRPEGIPAASCAPSHSSPCSIRVGPSAKPPAISAANGVTANETERRRWSVRPSNPFRQRASSPSS